MTFPVVSATTRADCTEITVLSVNQNPDYAIEKFEFPFHFVGMMKCWILNANIKVSDVRCAGWMVCSIQQVVMSLLCRTIVFVRGFCGLLFIRNFNSFRD